MTSTLLFLLLTAGAVEPPQQAKTVELSTILFESPEMLQECLKARSCEELHAALDQRREEEQDKIRKTYRPASKPVDDMTPEEQAEWKKHREQLRADLKEVDDRMAREARAQGCSPALQEPTSEALCVSATTAILSKGTEVTILKKTPQMFRLRVESGRATGKVGWVIRTQVSIEEAAK